MKPEVSERLFIESLFNSSREKLGTSATSLQNIERLTGDASTRRYYRLHTEKHSFVVCLDNPLDTGENCFVKMQEFLEKQSVRVPKIHDKNIKKGYLLEEDLGDQTLLQYLSKISSRSEEKEIYKKVISILLEMHKIPITLIEQENLFQNKFDKEKFMEEIKFSTKYFLTKFLNIDDDKICLSIEHEFEKICERIANEKMVFTHRDYHSRNIMIKDDEYIVIDFQDARWGIPQYDLVSMLEDCYYLIDEGHKQELIQFYYDNLPSEIHGQNSFDKFMSLYNDMALQRVFKAIGSFSYIYETRKDLRYVKYIGFAMEKIKQIMLSNSEYGELRKILYKYYYES